MTELLADLYVQLKRLHGSLRLTDVVAAMHEVLVNLVGTEDFAIFVRDTESGRYEALSTVGERASTLPARAEPDWPEALLTVPLVSALSPAPMGAVVIAALLQHKPRLESSDRTLLVELGDHAGIAMEAALAVEAAGPPPVRVAELRARLGDRVAPAINRAIARADGEGAA
jgi:hypothetical protein